MNNKEDSATKRKENKNSQYVGRRIMANKRLHKKESFIDAPRCGTYSTKPYLYAKKDKEVSCESCAKVIKREKRK